MQRSDWQKIWEMQEVVSSVPYSLHEHRHMTSGEYYIDYDIPIPILHNQLIDLTKTLERRCQRLLSTRELAFDEYMIHTSISRKISAKIKIISEEPNEIYIKHGYVVIHDGRVELEEYNAPKIIINKDETEVIVEDSDECESMVEQDMLDSLRMFTRMKIKAKRPFQMFIDYEATTCTIKAYDYEHIFGDYAEDYRCYSKETFRNILDEPSQ